MTSDLDILCLCLAAYFQACIDISQVCFNSLLHFTVYLWHAPRGASHRRYSVITQGSGLESRKRALLLYFRAGVLNRQIAV